MFFGRCATIITVKHSNKTYSNHPNNNYVLVITHSDAPYAIAKFHCITSIQIVHRIASRSMQHGPRAIFLKLASPDPLDRSQPMSIGTLYYYLRKRNHTIVLYLWTCVSVYLYARAWCVCVCVCNRKQNIITFQILYESIIIASKG